MATSSQESITEATTAELVQAARAHSQLAWEELVTRYSPVIRRVAASFRLPEVEAADITQNTWLCALEKLSTLRDPDSVGGWLRTIARRECLRAFRAMRREIPCETGSMDGPADAPGPDSVVLMNDVRAALDTAVGGLSDRKRQLIELSCHATGFDYRSLALAMDIPVGSIGPTRQRALRLLRKELTDAGYADACMSA